MTEKEVLERIEKAAREGSTRLDLFGKGLKSLPGKIGELTNLKELRLSNNQLTSFPAELGQLEKLEYLDLSHNQPTSVPGELGQLENLTYLDLSNNQLRSVPPELGQLENLEELCLHQNQLTLVPGKLGQFEKLRRLSLSHNQLTSVPGELGELKELEQLWLHHNELTSVPAELGQLENLKGLDVQHNQLTSAPAELGQLKSLEYLDLSNNQLTWVPGDLGQLTNLTTLDLSDNQLTSLPAELGQLEKLNGLHLFRNQLPTLPSELRKLKNLKTLTLQANQLRSVPAELGQLENLKELGLHNNQLTSVPGEFGQLGNLVYLALQDNQLRSVPAELGQLTKLEGLDLARNPLESPPPEVVEQGKEAIFAYLRGQLEKKKAQWVSKLLVVGEGGVGKTSLLRVLRGEDFDPEEETTHGMRVEKLELAHPSETGVTMELNAWDFGGQQIYHSTHQFFFTNRSLFVLMWDTRHGWRAGDLYGWLDTIAGKAPESPVMIVAAHIDEHDADLPLDDLRKKYPQIEGHYKVSNKKGTGIKAFKKKLAQAAADLPLMGEQWPASWLDAANAIRAREEFYISPRKLNDVMAEYEVVGKSAEVLGQWLHELGDILYFREDAELGDWVILNPQWVTGAISRVLDSEEVKAKGGMFSRREMKKLWADIDHGIRGHFLRLMEKFDLSYRTLEDREVSLVVEQLALDAPAYEDTWNEIKGRQGCKEISMRFELSSVPAGIPTWFIARSHRFTTNTQWKRGALFADEGRRHWGLVEAYPHERYVRLTVRGPAPQNFFAVLRDGLELTLRRFPGLRIKRTIPCPGHKGETCIHEFDFEDVQGAIAGGDPVLEVQCMKSYQFVSVTEMLFGLDIRTQDDVISKMADIVRREVGQAKGDILTELRELRSLTQREFLSLFNRDQRLAESHCPNVFAVLPKGEGGWSEKIFGQKMVLQLYCQAPGQWHPTVEGGEYEIKRPGQWLSSMGPYIVKLAKVIKYAAPGAGAAASLYAGPIAAVMGKGIAEKLAKQVKLMEELAKKIGDGKDLAAGALREGIGGREGPERIEGAALRALRKLLDEEDAEHHWGGLKKILTPEGHYLWLCEYHAEEYAN